jgi:hypothetical protein
VKRNWKKWERKSVIAQNEEKFEIFLDELRKTTNEHRIVDVGRCWNRNIPTIYFMNVTVWLIASLPVMYLRRRRNECRNFSGGPFEKNALGRLKKRWN